MRRLPMFDLAFHLSLRPGIGRMPVLQDGRLVGTVSRADICQAIDGAL